MVHLTKGIDADYDPEAFEQDCPGYRWLTKTVKSLKERYKDDFDSDTEHPERHVEKARTLFRPSTGVRLNVAGNV